MSFDPVQGKPLLEVRNLVKHFVRKQGLLRPSSVVKAVDDVSFTIDEGEMFGLVGESGSGKSTTGRCILRLIEPTAGDVLFRGENVLQFSTERMRLARRDMQIVFQDPYSSLNPRMRVGDIVEEPLVIHKLGSKSERRARGHRRARGARRDARALREPDASALEGAPARESVTRPRRNAPAHRGRSGIIPERRGDEGKQPKALSHGVTAAAIQNAKFKM